MAAGLIADDLTFVGGAPPDGPFTAEVRIRYRGEFVPAGVDVKGARAEVRFERPQRAVTPGQAVVFYDGDRVLGGGTITNRL